MEEESDYLWPCLLCQGIYKQLHFSQNSQFVVAVAGLEIDLELPMYNKSAFVEA